MNFYLNPKQVPADRVKGAQIRAHLCEILNIPQEPKSSADAEDLGAIEMFAADWDHTNSYELEDLTQQVALLLQCVRFDYEPELREQDFSHLADIVGCYGAARIALLRNGLFPRENSEGDLVWTTAGRHTYKAHRISLDEYSWDGGRLVWK